MASGQGTKMENDLVRLLDGANFSVIRSPSSGSRTDRAQPDILAAIGGLALALEAKYGEPPSNLRMDEVSGLSTFAADYGATPLAAIRYKGEKAFYLVRPVDLSRTPQGNYSIPSDPVDLDWVIKIVYSGSGSGVQVERIVDWTGDRLKTGWPLARWFSDLPNDRGIDFSRGRSA